MKNRLAKIAERAASSLVTLETSYDLAMFAIHHDIPGDFVECGVFHGAQCAAMALAIMFSHKPFGRRVHLFDSFEGVPEAGEHDKQWLDAGHPKGQSAATLEQVQQNMHEWGIDPRLLVYHPGLFSETVPYFSGESLASDRSIAILRLDGDLYKSTRVCIENLYPLVSPGGWTICDDFALDGARKAVLDYFIGEGGPGVGPTYFQRQP